MMMIRLFISFTIIVIAILLPHHTCFCYMTPGTWRNDVNGHTYQLVTDPRLSYGEALTYAKARGGYLASLTSRMEWEFLANNVNVTGWNETDLSWTGFKLMD
eukprot:TRINITY_DN6334_c1_g1_i3.p1 TRINITY_DN6334_c1_g1~~TRINITY_DN6334_c1_g1_i3.p1  ORF type:complete len:102 (+),score=15.20 TRINITY_DN6334_c1_g1_i3:159-464(+)